MILRLWFILVTAINFYPNNLQLLSVASEFYQPNDITMICSRCLHRASALPLRIQHTFLRSLTNSATTASPATPPTSPGPTISTPLPPKPKAKAALPVSAAPAGTILKGLNYLKGRDDPTALAEEEYPEWLWKCLEVDKKGKAGDELEGDEFCMSMPQ